MEYGVLKSLAILLTFFSLTAHTMETDSDQEKSKANSGLTLKEAQDYFYDKYKYYPWKFCGCCGVCAITGYTAAITTGVLLPIGGTLTGIYCYNYTNYM